MFTWRAAKSVLLLLLAAGILAHSPALGQQEAPEEFGIRKPTPRKETVLDLIFGSAPERATQRGILVIDAYEDLDNDGSKDEHEPELVNEITCQIDNIEYSVPAFIPGLDYNNRYEVRCRGDSYFPTMPDREILVEHRGHVIEIDLPCRRSEKSSAKPPPS